MTPSIMGMRDALLLLIPVGEDTFKSGDTWHLQKAQELREYVAELKTWIHLQEKENL
jgi:hypothetical protein